VKLAVAVAVTTVITAPFTGAPVTSRLLPEVRPWPVRLAELSKLAV